MTAISGRLNLPRNMQRLPVQKYSLMEITSQFLDTVHIQINSVRYSIVLNTHNGFFLDSHNKKEELASFFVMCHVVCFDIHSST